MAEKELEIFESRKNLHRAWEIYFADATLVMERYGNFCFWTHIKIKKDKKELYMITLDPWYSKSRRDVGLRTEFFFGRPFRAYIGNQYSFVEYISEIAEKDIIPTPKEYEKLGLSPLIENEYRRFFHKITNL